MKMSSSFYKFLHIVVIKNFQKKLKSHILIQLQIKEWSNSIKQIWIKKERIFANSYLIYVLIKVKANYITIIMNIKFKVANKFQNASKQSYKDSSLFNLIINNKVLKILKLIRCLVNYKNRMYNR